MADALISLTEKAISKTNKGGARIKLKSAILDDFIIRKKEKQIQKSESIMFNGGYVDATESIVILDDPCEQPGSHRSDNL